MFTGIIETTGKLLSTVREGSNLRMAVECAFGHELKVDQSVSHNGVCLTVVSVNENVYEVVAIDETLKRSNLGSLKPGDLINLERCLKAGDRLDGHIVQGHVDTIGTVTQIIPQNGSWLFHISYDNPNYLTVEKGSVSVNGVSLTVVDSDKNSFSIAIIPYTWEHTNLHSLKQGSIVNIEFDIVGKYVARLIQR